MLACGESRLQRYDDISGSMKMFGTADGYGDLMLKRAVGRAELMVTKCRKAGFIGIAVVVTGSKRPKVDHLRRLPLTGPGPYHGMHWSQ